MSNYKCQCMFVALFVLTLLQKAKAVNLKCYKCTTLVNRACWDPFNASQVVLAEECAHDYGCLKLHIPESYSLTGELIPEELRRGCVSEDFCNHEEHRSEHCSICSTFLCNSSFSVAPSILSVLGVILQLIGITPFG